MSVEPTEEEYVRDVKLVIEAEDYLHSIGWAVTETQKMNDLAVVRLAMSVGWT